MPFLALFCTALCLLSNNVLRRHFKPPILSRNSPDYQRQYCCYIVLSTLRYGIFFSLRRSAVGLFQLLKRKRINSGVYLNKLMICLLMIQAGLFSNRDQYISLRTDVLVQQKESISDSSKTFCFNCVQTASFSQRV